MDDRSTDDCANICVAILAAGGSQRLGRPKQLLSVHGRPLLQGPIDAALGLGDDIPVFVVLGADHEKIKGKIDFGRARVLFNDQWQSGMASSIRLAIECIVNDLVEIRGVVLMTADQPHVSTVVLRELVGAAAQTAAPLAVSSFSAPDSAKKIPGPPAYFAAEFFSQLLQLQGDTGARAIVQSNLERAAIVDFARGAIDIDTEADYASLVAEGSNR
ncbi:MAG: nucleotidyltransferase family protein [Cyanobacteria bacterium REEB67]|nr:nucleotidyltransferase family protein [Cyanobacteria bacterium REEB67]